MKNKTYSKLIDLICWFIILPMIYIFAKMVGFSKFFLIYSGLFAGGILVCLFILPQCERFNSYYENNKTKKYRFIFIYICALVGLLSGLIFVVHDTTGLFTEGKNDFGYSLLVFGFSGFYIFKIY